MQARVGVIIQGPLVTFGQGPNNSMVGFNVCDTILANVSNMSMYGYCYIVVAWKAVNDQEIAILEALAVQKIELTQVSMPVKFDPDHRYKQHYGVLNGAETLLGQNSKISHFVKIRSDMLMPEEFWAWVNKVTSQNTSRLYVSELMSSSFYMGDFIYVAKKNEFIDYLTEIVKYGGYAIHPSIAFDMGIKCCESFGYYLGYKVSLLGRVRFLRSFFLDLEKGRKMWNRFISQHIGVLPESIWTKIVWRDRKIGTFLHSNKFKFDTLPIEYNKPLIESAKLLLVQYIIYWNKCGKHQFIIGFLNLARLLLRKALSAKQKLLYYLILTPFFQKRIVLGRVACLGKDIFSLRHGKDKSALLINQQKTRVDLLCEWIDGKERPKSKQIRSHMSRTDIYPLIKEQESLPWLKWKGCDFILMDSFSELTDQKFSHKQEGWSFSCHYSDIKHTQEFDVLFENHGLLPIDDIENAYLKFFDLLDSLYPDKRIIFLHFPTSLDERKIYKERGAEILRVMKKIEEKHSNITNISIDDDKVDWHEEDKFPYHYSKSTNAAFLEQWNKKESQANQQNCGGLTRGYGDAS